MNGASSAYRRWGRIVFPYEIADGRPSGTESGPVITYRLSEEELARYRGGKRMAKFDKAAIWARFAAGEGETWAQLQEMARELGCTPQTLWYYRRQWIEAGRPGCQAQTEPAASTATEPAPVQQETGAEATQADSQPLPAEADDNAEQTEQAEESERCQEPAAEPTNLEAMPAEAHTAMHEANHLAVLRAEIERLEAERERAWAITDEALAAARRAQRSATGLCGTCIHHLDGFCPYPNLLQETYQLTDEELAERHRGRRIVFGRRQVIECDLYRADPAG